MPDLWDTNPDNVFSMPDKPPDPAPSSHDDRSDEVRLKDHRGRLRLPAYVLILLVTALAAVVVLTVALLAAPGGADAAVPLAGYAAHPPVIRGT